MMRRVYSLCAVACLVLAGACSEKPQNANTPRQDQLTDAGTGVAAFTAPGWKAGDKASWVSELKARQQYGQNEYSRMTVARQSSRVAISTGALMNSALFAALFVAISLSAVIPGRALAQSVAPAQAAAAAAPGIQSANIMDIKPEASADPNYASQTNGERMKVQPGNNAPMWRQVGQGTTGYSSLPVSQAPEAGNLIQPFVQYPGSRLTNAGEAWRQVRNQWLLPYGGALLVIALGAIALFYFGKGPIKLHAAETGRKIERFTPFERSAHWANAIAFCALAVSGIVMAFGKFFILPIIGTSLFGWLTYALKNLHNFAGPLFAVSLVIVFFTFLKDNWPEEGDLQWLLKGGGFFGGGEPPSNRFNAGEKIVFWGGVLALGVIVVASGFVLDKLVPGLVYERSTMQIANMVHATATVLMMAMFIGHIYIGTIGMEGAYKAMRTGYVDEAWAHEHHSLWHEDIKAGKIPAHRSNIAPSDPIPPATPAQPAQA